MLEELQGRKSLHRYLTRFIDGLRGHLGAVERFVKHFSKPPDWAGPPRCGADCSDLLFLRLLARLKSADSFSMNKQISEPSIEVTWKGWFYLAQKRGQELSRCSDPQRVRRLREEQADLMRRALQATKARPMHDIRPR